MAKKYTPRELRKLRESLGNDNERHNIELKPIEDYADEDARNKFSLSEFKLEREVELERVEGVNDQEKIGNNTSSFSLGPYLSFNGNASRSEFFFAWLISPILFIVGLVLLDTDFWLLFLPLYPLSIYVLIAATVRRLHDLGMRGDDIFGMFIPVYNIYLFLKLLLAEGEE